MSLLQMSEWIIKGGPVMWPIIIGSVIGFAIVLEKAWVIVMLNLRQSDDFFERVIAAIKQGKVEDARTLCKRSKTPLARILIKGLEFHGADKDIIEGALEREGNRCVGQIERGMGLLLTIIGIEPMLGFLGTITGLIRAFMTWEQLGSKITVNLLAGGMYEAMITTAAGLIVAIPLYLAYNGIIGALKRTSQEWSEASSIMVDQISHRGTKAS